VAVSSQITNLTGESFQEAVGAPPERCGVRTVPALVLFGEGAVAKRIFGARTRRYLREELGRLLG
jgi:hypothetical protein